MTFDRRFALREDPIVKAIVASSLAVPAHGTHMVRVHELVTSDGLDPHASPDALSLYRRRVESGDSRLTVFEGRVYHSRLEGGYKRVTADQFRNDFSGGLDEDEEVYGVYVYSHRSEELRRAAFREVVDVSAKLRDGKVHLMFEDGEALDVVPEYPLYALVENKTMRVPPS